jgi:hypothetical protein
MRPKKAWFNGSCRGIEWGNRRHKLRAPAAWPASPLSTTTPVLPTFFFTPHIHPALQSLTGWRLLGVRANIANHVSRIIPLLLGQTNRKEKTQS